MTRRGKDFDPNRPGNPFQELSEGEFAVLRNPPQPEPASRPPATNGTARKDSFLSSSLGITLLDEIKKHIVKGSEAALEPNPPDYLVEPYIIRGALHELVGKQKLSGKTTFTLHLAKACLEGGLFLGARVQKTGVLYLTEQPTASFRQALMETGLLSGAGVPDGFHFLHYFDVIAYAWTDVAGAAADYCLEYGLGLMIVDTLPQFAGIAGDGENSSGAALAAVKPLQEAAHTGNIAVIGGRHERKGGGSLADAGRGSSAFSGAVDMILRLKRPDVGTRPTIRELQAIGRFPVPESSMIELTPDGYANLGSEADVQRRDCEVFVLKRVPKPPPGVRPEAEDVAEEHGVLAKDLEAEAKKKGFGKSLLQDVLKSFSEEGQLCRRQLKSRGSPYVYWQNPSFLSSRRVIPREDERNRGDAGLATDSSDDDVGPFATMASLHVGQRVETPRGPGTVAKEPVARQKVKVLVDALAGKPMPERAFDVVDLRPLDDA